MTTTPEDLEKTARSLIEARQTNLGTEVTLPVLYFNGDAVNVVVTVDPSGFVVHDASAGAMLINVSGLQVTKKLNHRLAELVAAYGCEFVNGRVTARCTEDQLAVTMAMVSNASCAVGNEARQANRLRSMAFQEQVAERLRETVGKRVRERAEITAASGRTYRVGHLILDQSLAHPVAFVEAVANDDIVSKRVAEFFDLKEEYPDVQREAIYDDSRPLESFNLVLLGKVSNPLPFSSADRRLKNLLQAA